MTVSASLPVPPTAEAWRAAVQERLDGSDLGGALALAREAAAAHPGDLACQLQLGRILEQAGRYAEAVAHYEAVRARAPEDPAVAGSLAVNLARLGRGPEALALYRSAVAGADMPEGQRTRIARSVAAPLRRNPEAAALLAERLALSPKDAGLLREAGSAAASTNNLPDAIAYLDRSAARAPLPPWAHAVRIDARQRLARQSGRWPPVDAGLEGALAAALAQPPPTAPYARFLNRLPLRRPVWQRLYGRLRETVDRASKDGFLLYETMLAALQADERDLALELCDALVPGSDWAERAEPLRAVLERVPAAVWSRARLVDDKAAELQIVRVPGAEATLLVFATLTGNFMMLPLAMLDALLADLPVNVVYLRDTTSYAPGLRGFRSFGPRVEDAVERLRAEIAALGAPRLLVLGASASGLSAIRYGARLGAERVVTFGALSSLGPEFGRGAIQSGRLTLAAAAEARARFRDVADELSDAPDMRVAFHYGADYKLDVEHAQRVQDLPGVTIHAAAGVGHHYVVLSLIADGTFRAALWPGPLSPATPPRV